MSRASGLGAALGRAVVARLSRPQSAQSAPAARGEWDAALPSARPQASAQALQRTPEQERLARFMDRFCYYQGDYARQWMRLDAQGQATHGWARVGKSLPDRCALTPKVVEQHLRGQLTIGTYLLAPDDTCRLLVLDHDDKRMLPELDPATGQRRVVPEDGLAMLQDCRQRLAEQGIQSALGASRRGGHLFVFLDQPVAARDARALAMLALGPDEVERLARGEEAFEVYPKQEQRGGRDGAVGSNIALPLGVHLKDGQRHPFIDRHGESVAPTLSGQLDYLHTIAPCRVREALRDREWLYDALDRTMHPQRPREVERVSARDHAKATLLRQVYQQSPWAPPPVAQGRAWRDDGPRRPGIIARWKEGVDCRDVVQTLGVELNAAGVGRCPFHDDQHPSFQVWADGWRCHAEGRGGDALSFICENENLTPREGLAFARAHFPVPGLEIEQSQPAGRG